MYNRLFLVLICLVLMSLPACQEKKSNNELLFSSSTNIYTDLYLIIEDKYWNEEIKAAFAFVFQQEIKGLYSAEKEYDIVRISPLGLTDLFKRQRILIEVKLDAKVAEFSIRTKKNRWANGQIFIQLLAPDIETINWAILNRGNEIKNLIEAFNKEVFQSALNQSKVQGHLSNIDFKIPDTYVKVIEDSGFIYFGKVGQSLCESGTSFECPYQLGWFLSTQNYTSEKQFHPKYIAAQCNSLCRQYIYGPKKAIPTFMEIEQDFPLTVDTLNINGTYTIAIRGWWNMTGATMGGPFTAYTFPSKDKGKLMLAYSFVFAPNFKKRNFLFELNHISLSLIENIHAQND